MYPFDRKMFRNSLASLKSPEILTRLDFVAYGVRFKSLFDRHVLCELSPSALRRHHGE